MGAAICGTCCRVVDPQNSDEGYSHCCNDRIEYGLEAAESVERMIVETKLTIEVFEAEGEQEQTVIDWHKRELARLEGLRF